MNFFINENEYTLERITDTSSPLFEECPLWKLSDKNGFEVFILKLTNYYMETPQNFEQKTDYTTDFVPIYSTFGRNMETTTEISDAIDRALSIISSNN